MTIRIANAAGFWGDDIDAPRRVVAESSVDYLTLEYLAELTMSILAHLKGKNPRAGFATDILTAVRDILPVVQQGSRLRVITNAGGVNPQACAAEISELLVAAQLGDQPVGVVTGDDLLPRLAQLQAEGCEFVNLDTGQPLRELNATVASANAYLGARGIVDALSGGARFVVTGRVADASLTVAPVTYEFGLNWHDWDRLGAATVAGHLIECGSQVTGGYSDRWPELDFVNVGYPIAEVAQDGSTIITKSAGSEGVVDRRSVVEQLVYEIGDPANYLTPDVIADFTSVEVLEIGPNAVSVRGARGKPCSDYLKVSLAYPAGFMASGQLLVWGSRSRERAQSVGEVILKRLARAGYQPQQSCIECLGAGDGIPGLAAPGGLLPRGGAVGEPVEIVLRVTVRDSRREVVERFTKEIAPLITSGPAGLAGYAAGRPSIRPVMAYWPTLVPRNLVKPVVEVRRATEWCAGSAKS